MVMKNADRSSTLAVRVAVDGSTERVQLRVDETGSSAASLREAIGCRLFAAVELESDLDVWTDDDVDIDLDDPSSLRGVVNLVASIMISRIRGADAVTPIVGAAVFTGQHGGETLGLTEAVAQRLEYLAALCAVAVIGTRQ